MPFEHEQKFIMDRETDPEWLSSLPGVILRTTDDITQIYMDDGVRLRKSVHSGRDILAGKVPWTTYTLTYKRKTGGGVVEIETHVSEQDFALLQPLAARSISKRRHTFTDATTGFVLELDIFRDRDDAVYLAKIEVEYDLDQKDRLDTIEAMLAPRLVLRVGEDDKRFSNHRLADHYYALGLTGEIYKDHHRKITASLAVPRLAAGGAH